MTSHSTSSTALAPAQDVDRELRVGLVGLGAASRVFHIPLIAATPGLRIAAVASSQPAEAARWLPTATLYRDAQDLCADASLDLVVIATPPDTHADLATAALETGHHVVVEKPFTLDAAEARDLARLAQRQQRWVTVFQNRRYDSCFRTVRREIDQGTIGRVTHFESHFDRYRPEVRIRWKEAAGPAGGVWSDLGPHLVDQALLLFGKPEAVTATLSRHRDDAMADDWAHVVLHYPGLEAILHASLLVASGSPRFIAHGTAGSLLKRHLDVQEAQSLAGLSPTDPNFGVDPDPLIRWTADGVESVHAAERGCQQRFYAEVAAALRGTADTPVTLAEALATMEVLDAARRSVRERRSVSV
jgi:predicted dehydrogenase